MSGHERRQSFLRGGLLHTARPSDQAHQEAGQAVEEIIMARSKKKRKKSARGRRAKGAWRQHFGAVAKACFREGPTSGKEFGRCMKANL